MKIDQKIKKEENLIAKLKKVEQKAHKLNSKLFQEKLKWEKLQYELLTLAPDCEYKNLDFGDTQC
jgi:hypothetical protein